MTRLANLLEQIDAGTVLLPEFQRGYVWNRDQVRGLLRSLYLEHPVGGLLFWETDSDDISYRGDSRTAAGPRRLLLDGQQRVTTIYGVVRGTPPPFFEGDPKAFSALHFDVENEVFEFYSAAKMKDNPFWVDVTELFERGPMAYLRRFSPDTHPQVDDAQLVVYLDRLNKLREITRLSLNEEKITDSGRTVDDVVEIFNRVNSGGTKLSKGDLALASLCARRPEARQELRANLDRWNQLGYGFSLDWLLRNVTAVASGRSVFDALGKVTPEDFERALRSAARHIDTFLDAVSTRLGLDHAQVLMAPAALHVASRLLELNGGRFDNDAHRDRVLYWYIHAALWGRYTGSAETALQQDYEAATRGGVDALIKNLERTRGGKLTIRPDDFTGTNRGARFYPLLYTLTRACGARDLSSGLELRAENLGQQAALDIHRLFPNEELRKAGYERGHIQNLANFCILPANTVDVLKKRAPTDYLAEVERDQPGVLESQWIPTDPKLWRVENYLEFLQARRELVTAAAQKFLESLLSGDAPGTNLKPIRVRDESENPAIARLRTAVEDLADRGFVRPKFEVEVTDPRTRRELVVADALWPDGLQPGIGDPVVLIHDGNDVDLTRLTLLGYQVFTSLDELLAYANRGSETIEEAPEPEYADPEPVESMVAVAAADVTAEFTKTVNEAIARAINETGYRPGQFRRMVAEMGAVATARKLLATKQLSEGFSTLWEFERLDLTVEAAVLDERFAELFTDQERETARFRLQQFGFGG
ncbi:GmrSD restriction endonuclease domain-containing protein [Nocardia sp. R16R-3T]